MLYYYATDGVSDIKPVIRGQRHLKSLEGYDSELGDFSIGFNAQGTDLTYDHMISHTPGYEHIQTVMKFGLEMKRASKGRIYSASGNVCSSQGKTCILHIIYLVRVNAFS